MTLQLTDMLIADVPTWLDEEIKLSLLDTGWHHLDSVAANFAGQHHLHADVIFDVYPHGLIETEAVIETGSRVCFLNADILLNHAPTCLSTLLPCPTRFTGINGEAFHIAGLLPATCEIADKVINHHFVVANISVNFLL